MFGPHLELVNAATVIFMQWPRIKEPLRTYSYMTLLGPLRSYKVYCQTLQDLIRSLGSVRPNKAFLIFPTVSISHGNSVFDTHHLSELKTYPEMSSLYSAYSVAGI
jgi:hypothetical protein